MQQVRINQPTGATMRLHLCAADLPELQPAHSCGLPVSVQAGRGLISGPDDEPEHTVAMEQREHFYLRLKFSVKNPD